MPGKIVVVEVPKPPAPPPPVWDRKGRLLVSAKALKVTTVLDPAVLAGLAVPNGSARTEFVLDVGGRKVTGAFNSKSLRRAAAAIAEHGPEGVTIMVQGRLVGDALEDAGIVAQPKTPK